MLFMPQPTDSAREAGFLFKPETSRRWSGAERLVGYAANRRGDPTLYCNAICCQANPWQTQGIGTPFLRAL